MPVGLSAGLLARFDEASDKVVRLAEAIPAEQYGWRPRPGVRSISEVIVHIAMGNYYTTQDAGVQVPGDLPDDPERSVTSKAVAISFLRRANTHLRDALRSLDDAGLTRATTMFEQQTSYGNVYLFGISHIHEHLGQLIAYSRMVGVVPPWSAEE